MNDTTIRLLQRRLWVSAVCVLTSAPSVSRATGYYAGPLGSKALGRAGAFVALADDLSAVLYNPAGLARDTSRLRLQLDNRFGYSEFSFARDPTRDGRSMSALVVSFEPSRNQRPWSTLGPLLGIQSNLGLSDWSFALVSFTPSGAARARFPQDGGQKYLLVERDVVVLNTSLSAAWRPAPGLAFGISAQVISVPSIDYSLVIENTPGSGLDLYNPVSSPLDMLARIRGHDWFTLNLIAGLWGRPERHIEMGLSAQVLPSSVEASGTLHVEPIAPTTLEVLGNQDPPISPEAAVQLSRDGVPANDVRLTLPLPVTFRAGTRFIKHRSDGSESFDVEFDATYETWSRVDTLTMSGNGLEARLAGLSNNPIPLGLIRVRKGWQDTLTLALGSDVHPSRGTTVRGGVYVETPTAPPSYANIDFPSAAHWGATTGLSFQWDAWALNVAYEYRRMFPLHTKESEGAVLQLKPNLGENPPAAASPPVVNAGSYEFDSHNLILGLGWRLD